MNCTLRSRLSELSRLAVTSLRVGCSARQRLRPPQRALTGIPKRSLVICTTPDARESLLRDCDHPWRVRPPHGESGTNKGSICRIKARPTSQVLSSSSTGERPSTECVEGVFCELRVDGVLRSCVIFAAFATISATALVGSGRGKGEVACPPKKTRL